MAATTRFLLRYSRIWLLLLGVLGAGLFSQWGPRSTAQEAKEADKPKATKPAEPKKKAPAKPAANRKKVQAPALAALSLPEAAITLRRADHQLDFPDAAVDSAGDHWVVYLDHDGSQDRVMLARKAKETGDLEERGVFAEAGVAHQPALALTGPGQGWCFWGQVGANDLMQLKGRSFSGDQMGDVETLAASDGADSFADAGTDSEGRVWVAWQSLRSGEAEILTRYLNPDSGTWSPEILVSAAAGGQWEPRLAFDGGGNAWMTYDSSEGNEFNIVLARVSADAQVKRWPIAPSSRYEARADLSPTADGTGFWIAGERGRVRWGLDVRGHGNEKGLNAQKEILFGRFDIGSESFQEHPLGPAGAAGSPVNLPTVGVDQGGRPWVAYRYFERVLWRVAVTRFDPESGTWSVPRRVPESSFGQDRRSQFAKSESGELWFSWTTDLRKTKAAQQAGLHLARIDTAAQLPNAKIPGPAKDLTGEPFSPSQKTAERPREDRHEWTLGGATYGLYWGDFHRHTDVSNCRTGFDGCIVEHFRYAYDIGKLDFLGTSDHTDIGKIYDPYEWWHNQRMHDALHSPGKFNTMYVYEREQKWPWGHRNVVFAQRGGPIVYINRTTYRNSPWQDKFPVKPGVDQIHPTELWDILERYGKPVTAISHTGATSMGTDWGAYEEKINREVDTVVEIFQGARVSYEGRGVPQPTVGLRPKERYTVASGRNEPQPDPPTPITDFGQYNAGVYQNALQIGHRLGVFASSDHISQHASYGGVFCKEFTREGIIEGIRERRTMAATDKIYLNFTCNGEPLGSTIASSTSPELWFRVDGTTKLKRVTIVRNEKNWKVFGNLEGSSLEQKVRDEEPLPGENRYYLRVEQEDGNMAWGSPVWVTVST